MPPECDWRVWLLNAGRGFGKTRTGAEWIRWRVEERGAKRIAFVGRTAADVRDVMVEGESGILAISPPWNLPVYEPSKRRLTWPNGAIATTYSADEPNLLRGPQHDTAWADELASWKYPDAYDQLQFGLRLGDDPRLVVTTTPRPIKLIRDLMAAKTTVVTRGTTYDNAANLAAVFLTDIVAKYKGTRLGKQELEAALLEDVPGALWTIDGIAGCRVDAVPAGVTLTTVLVVVDPSGCSGPEDLRSDEVGISVVALGSDGIVYVLEDASGRFGPVGEDGWAAKCLKLYLAHRADAIAAETNFGGAMVAAVVRSARLRTGKDEYFDGTNVPFREITASRGKHVRAEPVAELCAKGRVKFVGTFAQLEDQLVQFSTSGYFGGRSPDRADAFIHGVHALGIARMPGQGIHDFYREQAEAALTPPESSAAPLGDAPVPLLAPDGATGTAMSRSGRPYVIRAGRIEARPEDVASLIAIGFERA